MTDRLRTRLDAGRQSGFTLIELLIVIVILGVLAAIVVFAVGGITDRGNTSACKADKKNVEVAEEAYYAKNGSYTDLDGLVGANLLREKPSTTNGYTITVTNGAVGPASCP